MRNKKIIRPGVCVVINSNRGFHQLVKKNDNFFCKRKIRGKQRLDSLPFKEKFIIIKHSLFENLIARLSDRFFVIDFFGLSRRMEKQRRRESHWACAFTFQPLSRKLTMLYVVFCKLEVRWYMSVIWYRYVTKQVLTLSFFILQAP